MEHCRSRLLFLQNLGNLTDHNALHDSFCAFGVIASFKMAHDARGDCRDYGFEHFDTDYATKFAVEQACASG